YSVRLSENRFALFSLPNLFFRPELLPLPILIKCLGMLWFSPRNSPALGAFPVVAPLRKTGPRVSTDCALISSIRGITSKRCDCHRSALCKYRRIKCRGLGYEALDRVAFLIKSSSSSPHLKSQFRASDETAKPVAEFFGVARANDRAGLSITNRLADTTNIRRDYRQASSHRLQDRARKAFPF